MRYIVLSMLMFMLPLLCQAGERKMYLELGVGQDWHAEEEGGDEWPQSVIRLRYEMPDNRWWTPDVIEHNHHSNYRDGWPFNHNQERVVDQTSIVWRFRLF